MTQDILWTEGDFPNYHHAGLLIWVKTEKNRRDLKNLEARVAASSLISDRGMRIQRFYGPGALVGRSPWACSPR